MNIKREIPFEIPISEIILEDGITSRASKLCSSFGKLHIICDENTKNFVSLDCDKTILPKDQKAEFSKSEELSKVECDLFIAVGSGTINDITKYAAFLAKKPYIVFGTAPSMNGYASSGASLLVNGHKKSFSAKPPLAIYLDTEILAAAPKRLTNAGIGDSICRATIQNDNLLSHKFIGDEYYNEYYKLMQKYESEIFHDIEALTKTLIFSGAAMLLAGNSAPASQGEHMLAHYMELMQPDAPKSFHGEQIAITTLTMAKIQNEVLSKPLNFEPAAIAGNSIEEHFGKEHSTDFIKQVNAKYSKLQNSDVNLDGFNKIDIRELESKLQSIGAPTRPSDIGWNEAIYKEAISMAKYTRDRFTFLDLK